MNPTTRTFTRSTTNLHGVSDTAGLIYVSWDGDHLASRVAGAIRRNEPEEARRIAYEIECGNRAFTAWALGARGSVVFAEGDAGVVLVPADQLVDLDAVREKYESATGAPVSIGVGARTNEAARALLVAKHHGGDQVVVYDEQVEAQAVEAEREVPGGDEPAMGKAEDLDKAVLDPSLGYRIEHETREEAPGKMTTHVTAWTPDDDRVGDARFLHDQNGDLYPKGITFVHPDHRRLGLASAMYVHAEKVTGKKVVPSWNQTGMGTTIWAGNAKHKQFGKAEPVSSPDPADLACSQPPEIPADQPPAPPISPIPPADLLTQSPSLQDRVRAQVAARAATDQERLHHDATAADEVRDRLAGILRRVGGNPDELRALVQAAPGVADVLTELIGTVRDLSRTMPRMAKAELEKAKPPYNPDEALTPQQEQDVGRWQVNQGPRDAVPRMEGPARERGLDRLGARTSVRRAPDGGREFLLHRAMGDDEVAAAAQGDHVAHPGLSSWSPVTSGNVMGHGGIVSYYQQEYGGKTASAWIHERNLHAMLPMWGRNDHEAVSNRRLTPEDREAYPETTDADAYGKTRGPHTNPNEWEVVVGPHRSPLATREEATDAWLPRTTLHGRMEHVAGYPKVPGYPMYAMRDAARSRAGARDLLHESHLFRETAKPEAKAEPVAKADPSAPPAPAGPRRQAGRGLGAEAGREHVVLPVGSVRAGRTKVPLSTSGGQGWREMRAGAVAAPDGTATSARHPNPKTGQMQIG